MFGQSIQVMPADSTKPATRIETSFDICGSALGFESTDESDEQAARPKRTTRPEAKVRDVIM